MINFCIYFEQSFIPSWLIDNSDYGLVLRLQHGVCRITASTQNRCRITLQRTDVVIFFNVDMWTWNEEYWDAHKFDSDKLTDHYTVQNEKLSDEQLYNLFHKDGRCILDEKYGTFNKHDKSFTPKLVNNEIGKRIVNITIKAAQIHPVFRFLLPAALEIEF